MARPGDAGRHQGGAPLVEGLTTATVVTDPSGAEPFGIEPESFDEALRRALAEEANRKGQMSYPRTPSGGARGGGGGP